MTTTADATTTIFALKTRSVPPNSQKSTLRSPSSGHERLKLTLSHLTRKNKVGDEGNRFLVMIYVMGSPGPLKVVVREDDKVGDVVTVALKLYAREGRFPALGCKASQFELHCSHSGTGAINESKEIGACGSRSFLLCKKNHDNNLGDLHNGGRVRRLKPTAYHLSNCLSFYSGLGSHEAVLN